MISLLWRFVVECDISGQIRKTCDTIELNRDGR